MLSFGLNIPIAPVCTVRCLSGGGSDLWVIRRGHWLRSHLILLSFDSTRRKRKIFSFAVSRSYIYHIFFSESIGSCVLARPSAELDYTAPAAAAPRQPVPESADGAVASGGQFPRGCVGAQSAAGGRGGRLWSGARAVGSADAAARGAERTPGCAERGPRARRTAGGL